MRHCVTVFYCTFVFLYNIVSGQLAFLLLINNTNIRDVTVSRPLFGLGLGLTVICLGLGLGLTKYWSRSHIYALVSWSQIDLVFLKFNDF